MDGAKRIKYHESCRKSAQFLDFTIAAPFNHLTSLSLAEGAHFDPVKRGQAIAGVGRSAAAPTTSVAHFADNVARDTYLKALVTIWKDMRHDFSSNHEIGSTNVDRLWSGIVFVLSHRVARSAAWGVPEVSEACKQQLDDIPAYRTNIASALARASAAHCGDAAARSVNRAYLQFFLPFWTEHILGQGLLEPSEHKAAAEELLKPPPPPAYAPPAPPAPPPPPYLLPPPPTPAPFHFFPHHVPYGPPPGLFPPPAAPRPPGTLPPANTPGQQRPPHSGFLGKPISPLICGTNFGTDLKGPSRQCSCAITRAFPGRSHYPFECPFKHHVQRGSCPGWTSNGTRIPSAWAGDDITPATQAEWRAMVPSLPTARAAGGQEAQF
jgi:hypothetical protein